MMRALSTLLVGVILMAGALSAQEPDKGATATSARAKETISNSPAESEYKIGPQDMVRIDVWKEPEISRTIPVRPDGKISLPLLNDVMAAGLTSMQLAAAIHDGLMKYLTSPQVTVTVTEINSRRVYVTGEVNRAGPMPLLPNMTALQAITGANGFTQFARTKGIYILRNEGGKQVKYPFNYKDVVNGKHPEQNISLLSGDVIVVP